jgi:DNA polymerase IV
MEEGRARKIIHIDMDAFYASVEQRDNSDLKNRPVAVGYPAKRGVVAAASYEARRFGVRSAMPSTVAMRRCPELVFVAPRFDVYRAVSQQVHAIFKDYTPLVEPLSLDEAYLDVTDNLSGVRTAWETAKEIRARILAETELTASAGVSCNKFLAKLASDQRKPNGQFAIMTDEAEAFVAALPIGKFHGVGRRPQPGCTRLALRQARICGVKPSTSCVRGSAKRAIGTLKSRVAETIVRFNPTGSENLRGRRRPSRRIWSIQPGSKRA